MSRIDQFVTPFIQSHVSIPLKTDKIYKEECCFSYETPESPDGLYIDLKTFIGYGKKYLQLNYERNGHKLYLHIKRIKKLKEQNQDSEPPKKKPTVMAIGSPGGFDIDESKQFIFEDTLSLVVYPENQTFPLPDSNLPQKVNDCINAILAYDSAARVEEAAEWKQEAKESTYAKDLVQLNNGVKVPPSGWKCSKCDLTENLWMSLTDGSILCGRKNFDGTGGNGHALEHFKNTGYPLCVKLGTICADPSSIDVFSYAEDDMVKDPFIAKHLAHFGIDLAKMEKTEKTISEMEIDQNLNFDWSRIQEQDKALQPAYGPGFTGLINLGNSCYMASVMQVVFNIPDFQKRYFTSCEDIFRNAPTDAAADFTTQISKLAKGLLSGEYSKAQEESNDQDTQPNGVRPRMFKSVIGKGHHEFSTMRQQDAVEFFQYLLTAVERSEKRFDNGSRDPSKVFQFEVQERIECSQSHKVKYTDRCENLLALPIPLDKATNREEVAAYEQRKKQEPKDAKIKEDPVRPRVPFSACLELFAADEVVPDFFSTAIQAKTNAIKRTRLATFPDVLVIQLRKFYVGEDWSPKKLDVFVDVPDTIDVEFLRGHGKQPNEETLPESGPSQPAFVVDQSIVAELLGMGFPQNRCEKAAYVTKNAGAEAAMNWLLEHMEDPDIDTPIEVPKPSGTGFAPNEEAIDMLCSMGFSRDQATKALKATDNNLERATEWIFSHMDDMDQDTSEQPKSQSNKRDGPGRYNLLGFISHMGNSTFSGHYVCHIKKDGKWYLFNDNKVAISENPPRDMGYLYFFQRA